MATITKREIVSDLSDQTGLSQSDVAQMVDAFIELVGKRLAEGNDVTFRSPCFKGEDRTQSQQT